MRVKAKQAPEGKPSGFYGEKLRFPGDVFTLADISRNGEVKSAVVDQFSDKWMIDVDGALEKDKDGSFKKVDGSYVLKSKPSVKMVKKEA